MCANDLAVIGQLLEEIQWSELPTKKLENTLSVTHCLLNWIFLAGKDKVDLAEIKESLSPRLLLCLRPIYLCSLQTAREFRPTRLRKALKIRSALDFLLHDTTRFFSDKETAIHTKLETVGINEICRNMDETMRSWPNFLASEYVGSDSGSDEEDEQSSVSISDMTDIPPSHVWWIHSLRWFRSN